MDGAAFSCEIDLNVIKIILWQRSKKLNVFMFCKFFLFFIFWHINLINSCKLLNNQEVEPKNLQNKADFYKLCFVNHKITTV
jgi:hypothetical protein